MWSLFIKGPVIAIVLTTIGSLTGGTSFMVTAMAVHELQRRKGYRPGEGELTDRENDLYYGVEFDVNSEHDLNQKLGKLLQAAPSLFSDLKELKFDMTVSEGEILRAMLISVMNVIYKLEDIKKSNSDVPDEILKQLVAAALPVQLWLRQFPRKKRAVV